MGQRLVNWENILSFFRWNFYLIRNYMWIRREMPFQVLSFRIYYWHKLYICTHIFIFVYTIYLHGSQSTQLKNLGECDLWWDFEYEVLIRLGKNSWRNNLGFVDTEDWESKTGLRGNLCRVIKPMGPIGFWQLNAFQKCLKQIINVLSTCIFLNKCFLE